MIGIGEREAFEAVYRVHYWQIVAYAGRRLSTASGHRVPRGGQDDDAARDAAQEVFVVAWRRRDELPDPALPWLYGIAAKVVANVERSGRRRSRLTARLSVVPDAPGAEPRPRSSPEPDDAPPACRALATLSPVDQEVLRLAAWEELGAGDIARVLGCSANTAAARLSRARKRLRHALELASALPASRTRTLALTPEVDHV